LFSDKTGAEKLGKNPKAAFTLAPVQVLVPVQFIRTGEAHMRGAFTNTCNTVAIKNLVKIVK